jgi:hypothetical protein
LSGFEWSISRPSGIAGVSAQEHVGDGHDGIVGKGGLWRVEDEERYRARGREGCHGDRAMGRKNMENKRVKIQRVGVDEEVWGSVI